MRNSITTRNHRRGTRSYCTHIDYPALLSFEFLFTWDEICAAFSFLKNWPTVSSEASVICKQWLRYWGDVHSIHPWTPKENEKKYLSFGSHLFKSIVFHSFSMHAVVHPWAAEIFKNFELHLRFEPWKKYLQSPNCRCLTYCGVILTSSRVLILTFDQEQNTFGHWTWLLFLVVFRMMLFNSKARKHWERFWCGSLV